MDDDRYAAATYCTYSMRVLLHLTSYGKQTIDVVTEQSKVRRTDILYYTVLYVVRRGNGLTSRCFQLPSILYCTYHVLPFIATNNTIPCPK
jgi:hypothetical protein